MDHPIVNEVLADPPLNTNTSSDYSHMSNKVRIRQTITMSGF